MVALSISVLILLFLITAFGLSFSKIINVRFGKVETLLLGLVLVNASVTIISLFAPISIPILVLFFVISLICLFMCKAEFKTFLIFCKNDRMIVIYTIPFLIVAYIMCLGPPTIYDTGLYHLQNIKWIEQYPVVPGLANLHARFGFNPNIFTLFALTSLKGIFSQEIFAVNFVIFVFLLLFIVKRLVAVVVNGSISTTFLFYFFILTALLRFDGLSSPAPDYIANCIALFLFIRVLDFSKQHGPVDARQLLPLYILTLYVITVKLSMIPLLLIPAIFFFYKFTETRKHLFVLGLVGSVIIIPWLIRNVILTGWIVYPFASLDLFSFDWKIPTNSVIQMKEAITGWARNPGPDSIVASKIAFKEWFPIWFYRIPLLHKSFFVASFL